MQEPRENLINLYDPSRRGKNKGFSRPFLIIVVALITAGLVGFGVWYWQQQEMRKLEDSYKTQITKPKTSPSPSLSPSPTISPEEVTNNEFELDKVKVGDKVVGMTIVSIEPYLIKFSGETTITGTYKYYGDNEAFLANNVFFENLDSASLSKIPKVVSDTRNIWFGFSNQDYAKSIFGSKGSFGTATIVINDYTINLAQSEVWNTATLIKVIEKF